MDIATIIAVVSLAVSLSVLWRQHQAAGRAHFTAEWESREALIYVNHGPGAATNVRAELGGDLDREQDTIEIPYIGAFQTMRIKPLLAWGAVLESLTISWRDNRRSEQQIQILIPERPASRRSATASSKNAIEKAVREVAREEAEAQVDFEARKNSRNRRS